VYEWAEGGLEWEYKSQTKIQLKMGGWYMVGDIVLLTIIGGQVVEAPYVVIGQLSAGFYCFLFIT